MSNSKTISFEDMEGIYPKELKTGVQTKTGTHISIAAKFIITER